MGSTTHPSSRSPQTAIRGSWTCHIVRSVALAPLSRADRLSTRCITARHASSSAAGAVSTRHSDTCITCVACFFGASGNAARHRTRRSSVGLGPSPCSLRSTRSTPEDASTTRSTSTCNAGVAATSARHVFSSAAMNASSAGLGSEGFAVWNTVEWYDDGGLGYVRNPGGSAAVNSAHASAAASRRASPPSGPAMAVHSRRTEKGAS
mmetsp:Transcript_8841/g.37412  ORF Transcript_8841/g.37412 Transcript_8841/m.37412 type:complete len:207 (+) Transcript_8841:89-709(+)